MPAPGSLPWSCDADIVGNDTRRFTTPRLASTHEYETTFPVVHDGLDETFKLRRTSVWPWTGRDVQLQSRRYEVWSPNSSQNPYFPGMCLTEAPAFIPAQQRRVDGHYGVFDHRITPQYYDPNRPWRAFVMRPRMGASDLNGEYEHVELPNVWRCDPAPATNTGRISRSFLKALTERNIKLDTTIEKLRDSAIELKAWNNRPREPRPDGPTLKQLFGVTLYDDAVDGLNLAQGGMKEKAAWLLMVERATKRSGREDTLLSSANDSLVGVWMNGMPIKKMKWFLHVGVPCFVIHEYRPGVDYPTPENPTIADRRRDTAMSNSFLRSEAETILFQSLFNQLAAELQLPVTQLHATSSLIESDEARPKLSSMDRNWSSSYLQVALHAPSAVDMVPSTTTPESPTIRPHTAINEIPRPRSRHPTVVPPLPVVQPSMSSPPVPLASAVINTLLKPPSHRPAVTASTSSAQPSQLYVPALAKPPMQRQASVAPMQLPCPSVRVAPPPQPIVPQLALPNVPQLGHFYPGHIWNEREQEYEEDDEEDEEDDEDEDDDEEVQNRPFVRIPETNPDPNFQRPENETKEELYARKKKDYIQYMLLNGVEGHITTQDLFDHVQGHYVQPSPPRPRRSKSKKKNNRHHPYPPRKRSGPVALPEAPEAPARYINPESKARALVATMLRNPGAPAAASLSDPRRERIITKSFLARPVASVTECPSRPHCGIGQLASNDLMFLRLPGVPSLQSLHASLKSWFDHAMSAMRSDINIRMHAMYDPVQKTAYIAMLEAEYLNHAQRMWPSCSVMGEMAEWNSVKDGSRAQGQIMLASRCWRFLVKTFVAQEPELEGIEEDPMEVDEETVKGNDQDGQEEEEQEEQEEQEVEEEQEEQEEQEQDQEEQEAAEQPTIRSMDLEQNVEEENEEEELDEEEGGGNEEESGEEEEEEHEATVQFAQEQGDHTLAREADVHAHAKDVLREAPSRRVSEEEHYYRDEDSARYNEISQIPLKEEGKGITWAYFSDYETDSESEQSAGS